MSNSGYKVFFTDKGIYTLASMKLKNEEESIYRGHNLIAYLYALKERENGHI